MASDKHYSARICRKGHTITEAHELSGDDSAFCQDCGSAVIHACPGCDTSIRGPSRSGFSVVYEPPRFCPTCGQPYPWTTKAEMISKVEDAILEEPGIDDAEKVELRSSLSRVARGQATDDEQVTVWKRVKSTAPNAWAIAQGIVVNVASAAIRKELGLS